MESVSMKRNLERIKSKLDMIEILSKKTNYEDGILDNLCRLLCEAFELLFKLTLENNNIIPDKIHQLDLLAVDVVKLGYNILQNDYDLRALTRISTWYSLSMYGSGCLSNALEIKSCIQMLHNYISICTSEPTGVSEETLLKVVLYAMNSGYTAEQIKPYISKQAFTDYDSLKQAVIAAVKKL